MGRVIWGRNKFDEQNIHAQTSFKTLKIRFNIKLSFSLTLRK